MKDTDPRALEEQTKELVTRAKQHGFAWKYARDDYRSNTCWITLYRSDGPPRMRYQFEESASGLEHLAAFLQEHGDPETPADPVGEAD